MISQQNFVKNFTKTEKSSKNSTMLSKKSLNYNYVKNQFSNVHKIDLEDGKYWI